ncbi:hypothetical protein ACFPOE_23905 [Caenimonas terrae]|uniref:Uncharacterized protein n=1 Tax=Caenimonas terrae TaxID=696074 RepID=A0ABW0NLZ8_9BURK
MSEPFFSDYGVELFKRDGRLFVRYDSGGFASRMIEAEVSEAQVLRLQLGEFEAYRVLLDVQEAAERNEKSAGAP